MNTYFKLYQLLFLIILDHPTQIQDFISIVRYIHICTRGCLSVTLILKTITLIYEIFSYIQTRDNPLIWHNNEELELFVQNVEL